MHDHVGDEGGDRREIAAGEFQGRAVIARRDEGKREQEFERLLVRQKAFDDLHNDHQGGRKQHASGNVEDRL